MSNNKNIYSFVSEDICLHFWSQTAGFYRYRGLFVAFRWKNERGGRGGGFACNWLSQRAEKHKNRWVIFHFSKCCGKNRCIIPKDSDKQFFPLGE